MQRRLPEGYEIRPKAEQFLYNPTGTIHQHQVYSFVRYLVERRAVRRVIVIGCGCAMELRGLDSLVAIDCFDVRAMREPVVNNIPDARFFEANLECGVDLDPDSLERSLIVCADVIQRLAQPEILLRQLAEFSRSCAYLLLSTPDRDRTCGLLDLGPPENPANTMEWSADEFGRFMVDCGFAPNFFLGHTFNNDHDLAKNTTLAIGGLEACYQVSPSVSVAAVMPVYNEEDVIEQIVRHLSKQGVEIHAIDNWSTDHSYEIMQRLTFEGACAKLTRFPDTPSNDYNWVGMLDYIASYAEGLHHDWVILHDADEIRWSPWRDATLQQAISFVDRLGYNSIDFTVLDFRYTSLTTQRLAELRFFEFGRRPGHFLQVKAWKNNQRVELSGLGGHCAEFAGRRTFPLKFLTQHFSLRSHQQATKKVFADRLPRIQRERWERGFHTQYDQYEELGRSYPWRSFELHQFHRAVFDAEYLIERLGGVGIARENRAIPNIGARFATENQLKALKNSVSWKLTAPFRKFRRLFSKRR